MIHQSRRVHGLLIQILLQFRVFILVELKVEVLRINHISGLHWFDSLFLTFIGIGHRLRPSGLNQAHLPIFGLVTAAWRFRASSASLECQASEASWALAAWFPLSLFPTLLLYYSNHTLPFPLKS